jgi:hypothetical protein
MSLADAAEKETLAEARLRDGVGNIQVVEEDREIRGWATNAVEAGSRESSKGARDRCSRLGRSRNRRWLRCPGGHESPSVKGTLPV